MFPGCPELETPSALKRGGARRNGGGDACPLTTEREKKLIFQLYGHTLLILCTEPASYYSPKNALDTL